MGLDERIIVQEIDFPIHLDSSLLEFYLDTLPKIGADDPEQPEWNATPIHALDLGPFGITVSSEPALVFVKDESYNPTGTLKDRPAHENGPVLYRRFAENVWQQHLNGNVSAVLIPRFSEITAGNMGLSQAVMNAAHGLPPPKLLLDYRTPRGRLDELKKLRADIYLTDMQRNIVTGRENEPYTSKQIRRLTNNMSGHDLTSSHLVQAQREYYDWHWHEIFNFEPDEVYGPFGSGYWFANGLTWQRETALNGIEKKDVRLQSPIAKVTAVDILAAEPERQGSEADKLTGLKPFVYYGKNDIQGARLLHLTGRKTGIYKVREEHLQQAYLIFNQSGFKAEKSAAAGLALYLQRCEEGNADPQKKVLVVNTGSGI